MTHYCLYRLGPQADLPAFLKKQVPGQWDEPWRGPVGSKGWMSVRAAITALVQSDGMAAMLKRCVSFSGDVDTVATIALAAGSCCREIKQDLPEHLCRKLENGKYGRAYLIAIDERLMKLVKWRR